MSAAPFPKSRFSDALPPEEAAARHRLIGTIADELRQAHWHPATLPVSAQDLAEGAGVEVRDRGGAQEPLYPYRGRLLYLDERPVIEVNLGEDAARRRIVLAHALGHHLLGHGPVPPETLVTLSTCCPRRIEQEAHHFALDLLMPEVAIYRLMDHGMLSARKLANKFQVPEASLHERMQALDRRSGYL